MTYHLPLVQARIGNNDYTFAIDTEAEANLIDVKFFERVSVIIVFIFPVLSEAQNLKCSFEEVYQNGEVQKGKLFLQNELFMKR